MNIGEQKAYDYFTRFGWEVVNLTKCSDFFGKDIDFLIRQGNEQHYIEVKWDGRIHQTGNMFVEIQTDIDEQKDGWFRFCAAEFIFYGSEHEDLFYVFRLADLKQFIKEQMGRLEERKAADYDWKGQVRKVSEGILVPIDKFREKYPVQIIRLSQPVKIAL